MQYNVATLALHGKMKLVWGEVTYVANAATVVVIAILTGQHVFP